VDLSLNGGVTDLEFGKGCNTTVNEDISDG
jgi:hypothetical protein